MTRPQEIRHEALLQLYGAGQSMKLSAEHVAKVAKRGGFDYSAKEVEDALLFLAGQGFAKSEVNSATGEIRYQITSAGVLQYENQDH